MANNSDSPPDASFRASVWTTPALCVGLVFLLLWRLTGFVELELIGALPPWILLLLTGVLPELSLLIFPLVTRRQEPAGAFRIPQIAWLAKEAAIAVPVIIGCVAVVVAAQYLIAYVSPGTSAVPDEIDRLSKSPGSSVVYGYLLAMFLFGPIAEEVFFRGFLFNAFRSRMPVVMAVFAQSFIFGFIHSYGSVHAVVASVLGVLLTAVYCWRKTILAPIFVHAGYNALVAASIFLAMQAHANSAVLGVVGEQSASTCVAADVLLNSPAATAGLQPSDTITHFGGYPITDFPSLVDAVSRYEPGDSVFVTLVRNGATIEVPVTLTSRRDLSNQ